MIPNPAVFVQIRKAQFPGRRNGGALPSPVEPASKGFHRIRHYGLLTNGNRAANTAHARKLLAMPLKEPNIGKTVEGRRAVRVAASMPVLRRPHDHHRDLHARL
jgi:hypothetical protein